MFPSFSVLTKRTLRIPSKVGFERTCLIVTYQYTTSLKIKHIQYIRTTMAKRRLLSDLERLTSLLSRTIWPWPESRLPLMVVILIGIDFLSTVTFLRISGGRFGEAGLLASWALQTGGYTGLFIMDLSAIGLLVIGATSIKRLYIRKGRSDLGRTAFVLLLAPYAVATVAVVCNNIIIIFLVLGRG